MAFKKISIRDVATLFINKVHLVKFLPILKSILKNRTCLLQAVRISHKN